MKTEKFRKQDELEKGNCGSRQVHSVVRCYPEMNREIINILRGGDNAISLYAAQRIEDLQNVIVNIPLGRLYCDICYYYDSYCTCSPNIVDRTRKEFLGI
jgi:hypothetical protein